MHKVRLYLRFEDGSAYEVYFSEKLTLKENIDLLYELSERKMSNYLVMLYDSSIILDISQKLAGLKLADGTVLHIYDFTNAESCIKITP